MIRAVTFFALVIGLLRASKEIPDLIKDLAKNAGGLLQGIELDPRKSYKKSKEALDKPVGALAGGLMGGISARNAIKKEGGSKLDRKLATLRGIQMGGKAGMQTGISKGMLTNAMSKANDIAINDKNERDKRMNQFRNGQLKTMVDELSQGRIKSFTSALKGGTLGLDDRYLYEAGEKYQENATGAKQFFSSAGDVTKNKVTPQVDHAMNSTMGITNSAGEQIKTFTDSNFGTFKGSVSEITKSLYQQAIGTKTVNSKGETEYSFGDKKYNNEFELRKAVTDAVNKNSENVLQTEFRGKMYEGTYSELEKQLNNEKDNFVRNAEINAFKKSLDIQGSEIIRSFADSASALDSHYFDSIGPGLQNEISSVSEKTLNEKCSADFKNMLKEANNGRAINISDSRSIMDLISSDKFIADYSGLDDARKDAINKDLAAYFHQITKAEEKVAKEIAKNKASANGAKVNRYTGVTENVLSSSKKNDKK